MNLGFGMSGLGSTMPTLYGHPTPRRSWQSRLYDRMMPDQQGPFAVGDDDKKKLMKQGLLQLGIGLLQNNNLAQGLGAGLQGGLLSMQDGAHNMRNDRYQQQMMARTMAGMDRNTRMEALQQQIMRPDGSLDEGKFREFAMMDPQAAKAFRDAIDPRVRYAAGEMSTPGGGTVPFFFNPEDPTAAIDLSGNPLVDKPRMIGGTGANGAYQIDSSIPENVRAAIAQTEATGGPMPAAMNLPTVNFADPYANRPGYVAPKPVAAPKTSRRYTPEEAVAAGYPAGSVVMVDSDGNEDLKFKPESKDQPGGKALLQGTVEKLTKDAGRRDNLVSMSATFKDEFAGNKVGGSTENLLGRMGADKVGLATEGQSDWWQRYDKHKNEVRNELFGASLTASEQAAFEAADVTPNMHPDRIRKNLKTQQEIIEKGLRRKGRTWAAQGYNRDAIQEAIGISLDEAAAEQPSNKDRKVKRTGIYQGRKVVEYTDGSTAYAD